MQRLPASRDRQRACTSCHFGDASSGYDVRAEAQDHGRLALVIGNQGYADNLGPLFQVKIAFSVTLFCP
jgi:hypothetical protein